MRPASIVVMPTSNGSRKLWRIPVPRSWPTSLTPIVGRLVRGTRRPDWRPESGRCRSWLLLRRGWSTSRPPELEKRSASGASWVRQTLLWRPSALALSGEGTWYQKLVSCSRFLTQPRGRYSSWRRPLVTVWRRVALWHRRWPTTCSCASGAVTPASPWSLQCKDPSKGLGRLLGTAVRMLHTS
jgi:hypothetical protein